MRNGGTTRRARASAVEMDDVACPYWPRRPDFDDVECGLTTVTGAATRVGAGCFRSAFGTVLGRFREKSGMLRFPFFFMRSSWSARLGSSGRQYSITKPHA